LSNLAVEIVTGANGDPPGGGSNIPFTVNIGRSPFGTRTGISDPIVRWCFFA